LRTTALKFLNSAKLGSQYQNDIFVGDVNTGSLYHFKLNQQRDGLALTGVLADKVANTPDESQQAALGHRFGTITDLQVGPDGYLYVLTFAGNIYRIVPSILILMDSYPHGKVSESSDNNRNTQSTDSTGSSDNSNPGVLHGGPNSDSNNGKSSSNHNTKNNPNSATPGKLVEVE
jgi:hypothetical protein